MIGATPVRSAGLRSLWGVALLLFLAGCVTPSQNRVHFRANGDATLITKVTEGLFLTTVRIGDHEAGPFLIDTGATSIVLDSELGKTANLASWIEVDHPDFTQKVTWGVLPALGVGRLTFQNTQVVVMDLSTLSAIFGERLAGILGSPLFAQSVVEVDYSTGSIACFDPKTYRLPKGEWLPLTIQDGRPFMPARGDGNIAGQFLLDTGSNFSVLLYPEFARHRALSDHRKTGKQTVVGVDGRYDTLRAQIAWFEFAGRRFEQPEVNFAVSAIPKSFPARVAGVIGQGLLQDFTVIFNLPEAKISLLPRR